MVVTKRKNAKCVTVTPRMAPLIGCWAYFLLLHHLFFLFGESKQFQTKPGSRTVIRINVEINHNFFRSPDNDLYANVGTWSVQGDCFDCWAKSVWGWKKVQFSVPNKFWQITHGWNVEKIFVIYPPKCVIHRLKGLTELTEFTFSLVSLIFNSHCTALTEKKNTFNRHRALPTRVLNFDVRTRSAKIKKAPSN